MILRFDSLMNFIVCTNYIHNSLQEYIHRVGRTARGEGSSGHALLILRPEEVGFLRYLKQAKVPLNEFEFSWSKIADIQLQVSALLHICLTLISTNSYFPLFASLEAFRSKNFCMK